MRQVMIVIGSGEIGSAIAVILQRAGYAVVLCDDVDPAWARRGMSFTNAWYVGNAELDGDAAVFCASVKSIPAVLKRERLIAATTWSWMGIAEALDPIAVVDSRTRRRDGGDGPKTRARAGVLTIGIGAGFVAGCDVDLAIEPAPGGRVGMIAERGTAVESGDTAAIASAIGERIVHAPRAGRFATSRRIGDRVIEGEIVGVLGTTSIAAPIGGVLRGLSARGARVAVGDPIVEVDPRGDPVLCFGLEERALATARGVEAALASVVASRSLSGAPREAAAAAERDGLRDTSVAG